MITFGSDVADLILQRTLGENTLGLNNSINRMTTGYKVNQAKDNAAGYSIITDLSKKISSMLQVQQNTEDGIALLQTAEGGLEEVQKLLERLRDLATQASNGTYDAETREAMQAEADQILEQISQIRESIQYDNQNLYYRENNGNTTKTKSDDTISKNPAGRAAALSAVSFSANALSSALEGAEAFAGGETRTITIDGVQYTVKNKLTTANDLSYSKDTSTGELTLIASNFEIRGQEDVVHNLIISGRRNNIYGGKLDDKVEESDSENCYINSIYGGEGNDTIILRATASGGYGEAGDDILTGYGGNLYGGEGNDILNVYTSGTNSGGEGNDVFNIYQNNNTNNGDDGDDTFNIIGSLSGVTINGGTGTNTVTGEVGTNTTINVVGANSGVVSLVKGVEQKATINGIDYTMSATLSSAEVIYKLDTSGQITFTSSSGGVIIKGDVNKKHNVVVRGVTFYGGNQGDTILANANNTIVYCGNGSNKITITQGLCYGGAGNNEVSMNKYTRYYGGSGVNNITLNGTLNNVEAGSGTTNVTIKGHTNNVYGTSGNNTIVSNTGSNNFISGFAKRDKDAEYKWGKL